MLTIIELSFPARVVGLIQQLGSFNYTNFISSRALLSCGLFSENMLPPASSSLHLYVLRLQIKSNVSLASVGLCHIRYFVYNWYKVCILLLSFHFDSLQLIQQDPTGLFTMSEVSFFSLFFKKT